MSDEQRPEWDDFYQPPDDLNKTTSGEANRTELMRPTVDSFDERLERVRSRQTISQPMRPVRRRRTCLVWPVTLLVLLLTGGLVVLSLFLPPFSQDSPIADALDSGSSFTTLNSEKTRVEKDGLAVEVHPGDPGENFGVALQSVSPEAYRTGDVPSEQWTCPPAETLPETFTKISAVYSLATEGTPPTRVGLHVPATEQDVYGWYGSTWNFVSGQLSTDGKTRVTDIPVLPECLVVTEVKSSALELTVNLDLGQARSDAITMHRLFIRGMQPTLQGSLQGVLPADTPASPGYPVIPLISNYTDANVVDAATIEAILRSPEMRLQHSANIAGFAEVNNYPAVALDYRGISPELRNQFSDLIKNITRVLRPQGRALIVIVPPAGFEDGWQTGAYDWRTLGLLVDELVIRLPLNPEAYLPNGEVDTMLQWAVGEVSRTKISLAVSALSIETALENPARLVTLETAWQGLGDVAFNEGVEYIAPDGEVTAFLNTPYQTQLGLDETIQAPFVTYRDRQGNPLRSFWLTTASALLYRMQKAAQFNVKGVMVTDIFAEGVDASVVDALVAYVNSTTLETESESLRLHWKITDSAGEVITEQEIPAGETLHFTPPENAEHLRFEVSVTGYGQIKTIEAVVATPTPGGSLESAPAEVAEAPVMTPTTSEPTLTPTVGPTPIPVLMEGKLPPDFEIGGHISGVFDESVWEPMRRAGMNWVKLQIRFERGMNPADEGWKIQLNNEKGFKVLFGVVGHKEDLLIPGYYEEYAAYVAGLAERGASAIEVWNEMNLDREWPNGRIDPKMYTELLKVSYEAIKAANPSTLVISGALAPTGAEGAFGLSAVWNDDRYYQGLADAGAGQYMDCVGVHYNEGIVSPLATSGDPRDPYPTRYLTLQTDRAWKPFNGEVPVCYTEMGYLSPEGYGPLPAGFEWAGDVTIKNQAEWLGTAALINAQSGKVGLMIIWNVDYKEYGADPLAGYAIIRSDGSCPACDTLGSLR